MTQTQHILGYLKTGKRLTALQALRKWGCFRLASRVLELRNSGYAVRSELRRLESGKRVANYWLAK